MRHTAPSYSSGCRCDACRAAAVTAARTRRRSKTGLPDGDPRHGTTNGYGNHSCRCDECRAAWRAYLAEKRARRIAETDPASLTHGSSSTYRNYGCRCDECRAAWAEAAQARRERRKQREMAARILGCDPADLIPTTRPGGNYQTKRTRQ